MSENIEVKWNEDPSEKIEFKNCVDDILRQLEATAAQEKKTPLGRAAYFLAGHAIDKWEKQPQS